MYSPHGNNNVIPARLACQAKTNSRNRKLVAAGLGPGGSGEEAIRKKAKFHGGFCLF
jgi:hypothetical protein